MEEDSHVEEVPKVTYVDPPVTPQVEVISPVEEAPKVTHEDPPARDLTHERDFENDNPRREIVSNRLSVSDAPSNASRFQEDFMRLQVLSGTGPPRTLAERYERQQIANRLSLGPVIYNMLVFGEIPPPSG